MLVPWFVVVLWLCCFGFVWVDEVWFWFWLVIVVFFVVFLLIWLGCFDLWFSMWFGLCLGLCVYFCFVVLPFDFMRFGCVAVRGWVRGVDFWAVFDGFWFLIFCLLIVGFVIYCDFAFNMFYVLVTVGVFAGYFCLFAICLLFVYLISV